jgi:hypothetical protein
MSSHAETEYVYALANEWERAERRLRALEATYDPVTKRRLAARGVADGWNCLEVGAGAGSIARWLGEQVGPTGEIGVECEVPFAEGGSLEAECPVLSFDQLNEVAGGNILDAETIARWKDMLGRPGRWFACLGLIATWGRRAG